jgi:hypothetical protein
MMPVASRPVMRGYFRPFQAVSNRGETDKLLIIFQKMLAVSLFHRFWECCRETLMEADG